MFRITVLLATAVVVLLGLGATFGVTDPRARAQAGTPTAQDVEILTGVTFAPLAFGVAAELPAAPAGLSLLRATLDPGAILPIEAVDASVGLAYVESGALTARVATPLTVLRGATSSKEEFSAETEFTLMPGDSVVLPPNVAGEIRNDGIEPAVALAALVAPLPALDAGTPAP